MGAVLKFAATLVTETCATCGMEFGAPKHFFDSRRADKREFYCPNGHVLVFNKNETDALREALAAEKARADREAERAARNWREKEAADRKAAAARGQATRLRNRVRNGVCPCCKRTFRQLAEHMKTQHPEFPAGGDKV